MSAETDGGAADDVPRVYRCLECKAPIGDLAIAPACEECGARIGDDRYLIDSVSPGFLAELREETDGCLNCGADTDTVFCCTGCNQDWMAKYTDAYLR